MCHFPEEKLTRRFSGSLTVLLLVVIYVKCLSQEAEIDLTVAPDFGEVRSMATQLPEDSDFKEFQVLDFRRLTLNDPRLQSVYVRLFVTAMGGDSEKWRLEGHVQAALDDLRIRGNEATPMLLKLMRDNPYSSFEAMVLLHINAIGTMDAKPYLEYARKMVDTRYDDINPSLASAAARLLVESGDASDIQRLKDVKAKRPYLNATIDRALSLRFPSREAKEAREAEEESSVGDQLPTRKARLDEEDKQARFEQVAGVVWVHYRVVFGIVALALLIWYYLRRKGRQ